ncbi:hypothetical protein Tco_0656239 [Tanacetum coccineum]|uniref:Uncharacterized protein n=1 Tax=Tanacetum coccineum TaxID=301880 RepID=A0ABQ4X876_9ASTR
MKFISSMSTPSILSTDSQMHNNYHEQLVSKIVQPCLDQEDILSGVHVFYDTLDTKECKSLSESSRNNGEAETVHNMSKENKLYFKAEKEAIFFLLTGIGDEIYSTVDACNTANEMWTDIERLQQGESLNIQDVKTNLNQSDRTPSLITTLFDILSSIKMKLMNPCERIAKCKSLALLAAAQPYSDNYYQAPKPQRTNATSSSTRPSASTRHKGKEIAKLVTPQSDSVSEERPISKKLYILHKNNLRTSSNSKNKTEDTTPRYNNDNQLGQFRNQRTMTVAGAREIVGSQVVQQNGIQCFNCKGLAIMQGMPDAKMQVDWLEDTDEEIDEQELEAHYGFMAQIQEVLPAESSSTDQPLEQVDQNDAECIDERAALANLSANLTLDMRETNVFKAFKKDKCIIDSR